MKIITKLILNCLIIPSMVAIASASIAQTTSEEVIPVRYITSGIAALSPTKNHSVSGVVKFFQVQGGVKIVADVTNLTPGEHGFHIHEFDDCSAPDASSAGAHFNPTHMPHGGPDAKMRHAGDLGNLIADQSGKAHYERINKKISLNGPASIIEHSVIIHAGKDDLTSQPSGSSGERVACGVIQIHGEVPINRNRKMDG